MQNWAPSSGSLSQKDSKKRVSNGPSLALIVKVANTKVSASMVASTAAVSTCMTITYLRATSLMMSSRDALVKFMTMATYLMHFGKLAAVLATRSITTIRVPNLKVTTKTTIERAKALSSGKMVANGKVSSTAAT